MQEFAGMGRDDRLRPLNAPRMITVATDKPGRPVSVARVGANARKATVASILDRWRIDEEGGEKKSPGCTTRSLSMAGRR